MRLPNTSIRRTRSRSTLAYPWSLQVRLWNMRTQRKQDCRQQPSSPANHKTTWTRNWRNTRRPSISFKVGHSYRPSFTRFLTPVGSPEFIPPFCQNQSITANLTERILTETLVLKLNAIGELYSEYTKVPEVFFTPHCG